MNLLKYIIKKKKIFEKNFEEFRRIITDISEIIKTKSSENDFKNFETIINIINQFLIPL
jgi:hypothetical protein